ncbi:transient receptor potential cation channel subfamily A member 1 homolog [Palaemon carinicauda]|uniref:transient receptor potential cation channel subfamily A member 1 homolog n=1 Tax=Palaemon carinicauda TaxID=392227 RepID=UPI0035B5ACCD
MASLEGEQSLSLATDRTDTSPQPSPRPDHVVINCENGRTGRRKRGGARAISMREEYNRTIETTTTPHVYKDPLLQGVLDKNPYEYRVILELSLDVNVKDHDSGDTAMHIAARHNKKDILDILLERGADCNAKNNKGETPLNLATQYGQDECCKMLINYGPLEINSLDQEQNTLLHIATKEGRFNVCRCIIQKFVEKDAVEDVINSKNIHGTTPLHFSAKVNNRPIMELLLQSNADRNCVDKDKYLPLHYVSEKGYVDLCELLLSGLSEKERKKALETLTRFGHTPLMLAAKGGHRKCCEIMKDWNMNGQDRYGKDTALHFAVRKVYQNTVTQLLENGANPNLKNKRGYTPLHEAIEFKEFECIKALVEDTQTNISEIAAGKKNVLHLGAEAGIEEAFQFLVESLDSQGLLKEFLKAKDKANRTPLHVTIKNKQEDLAIYLLDKGSSPIDEAAEKLTPLHIAAEYGCFKVCEVLLSKDEVQVNREDKKKVTPLHLAAFSGSENICRALIKKGANIRAKDSKGMTAIHIASSKGYANVVKFLIKKKAVVNEPCGNGCYPLHLAASAGSLECCKILVAHSRDVTWREDATGLLPFDFSLQKEQNTSKESLMKSDETFDFLLKNLRIKHNKVWQEKVMLRIHQYMEEAIAQKRRPIIKAIIGSNWWASGFIGENGHQCQNFRHLIQNFPVFAAELMSKCISQDGKIKTYDFFLFEDNHFIGKESAQLAKSPFDPKTNLLLPDAKPYGKGWKWKVHHPVAYMAKYQRLNLLNHPLTEKWLDLKWEVSIRLIFYSLLALEVVTLIFLGIFLRTIYFEAKCPWEFRCWCVLLVFEIMAIALEINSFCLLTPVEYLRRKRDFVQIGKIFCIVFLLIPWRIHAWRLSTGIMGWLLSGLHLIFTVNQIPRFSIFMPITVSFLSGFLLVWLFTAMILFIFAFIFHLLLKKQDSFATVPQSMVKTIVWMIGDLGYDDTFLSEEKLEYPILSNLIFVIFITVLGGVLTNFIIHQPSNKLEEFRENSRLHKAVNRVNLIMNLEVCFPFFTRDKAFVKHTDTDFEPSCCRKVVRTCKKLFIQEDSENNTDSTVTPDPIKLQLEEMNEHLSEILKLKVQLSEVIYLQREIQKTIKPADRPHSKRVRCLTTETI